MPPENDILGESTDDKFFESGGHEPPAPEPEPNPEPAPEPEAAPKGEKEPAPEATPPAPAPESKEQKEPKVVPLAALHEERERRRELSEELRQAKIRVQRIENTWGEIQKRMQEQQAQQQQQGQQTQQVAAEDEAPNYEDDPAGFLRWQQEQIGKQLMEVHQWRTQQEQAAQQQRTQQQFYQQVTNHESQFRAKNPDYDHAVNFLRQRRDSELQGWGILDPNQRSHIINQEVSFLANVALQNGESPAERAYETAKMWGWGQQQQAAPQTQQVQQTQQAAAQPPVPQVSTQVAPEQKMQALEKGQQAARSLSGAGGQAPQNLTLESLADIDDPQEFDRQWEKLFGKSKFL